MKAQSRQRQVRSLLQWPADPVAIRLGLKLKSLDAGPCRGRPRDPSSGVSVGMRVGAANRAFMGDLCRRSAG